MPICRARAALDANGQAAAATSAAAESAERCVDATRGGDRRTQAQTSSAGGLLALAPELLCRIAHHLPRHPVVTNWPTPRVEQCWTLGAARLVCRQWTAAVDAAHPAWLAGAASGLTGAVVWDATREAGELSETERGLLRGALALEVETGEGTAVGYAERFPHRQRALGRALAEATKLRRLGLAVPPTAAGWVTELFGLGPTLVELDLVGKWADGDTSSSASSAEGADEDLYARQAPMELATALPERLCAGLRSLALAGFLAADGRAVGRLVKRLPNLAVLRLVCWDLDDDGADLDVARLHLACAARLEGLFLRGSHHPAYDPRQTTTRTGCPTPGPHQARCARSRGRLSDAHPHPERAPTPQRRVRGRRSACGAPLPRAPPRNVPPNLAQESQGRGASPSTLASPCLSARVPL